MTKLDAVNLILRAVSMQGVATLDTDGNSDASRAERVLDEVELEVQSRGWYYNTRREVTLSPADGGTITAISLASPSVITCVDHGLQTGQTITIAGSDSTPTVNGDRVVTVLDDDRFTVPVNVTVAGTTGTWTNTDAWILLPDGVITIDSDGTSCSTHVTQVGNKLYDLDDNTDAFTSDLVVTYTLRLSFGCIPQPIQQYIACLAARIYNDRWGHPTRKGTLVLDENRAHARARRFNAETADVNVLDSLGSRQVRGSRARYWA